MENRLADSALEELMSVRFKKWYKTQKDVDLLKLVVGLHAKTHNTRVLTLLALTKLLAKWYPDAIKDATGYVEHEYGTNYTVTNGVFEILDDKGQLIDTFSPFWAGPYNE
jgi:hypothetical protein